MNQDTTFGRLGPVIHFTGTQVVNIGASLSNVKATILTTREC